MADDADKNECPFCGMQFDPRGADVVKLPKIRKRKLHWKQVGAIKLLCKLSQDVGEIDHAIFKQEHYFELLQKRTNLLGIMNTSLSELLDRLVTHQKKS